MSIFIIATILNTKYSVLAYYGDHNVDHGDHNGEDGDHLGEEGHAEDCLLVRFKLLGHLFLKSICQNLKKLIQAKLGIF